MVLHTNIYKKNTFLSIDVKVHYRIYPGHGECGHQPLLNIYFFDISIKTKTSQEAFYTIGRQGKNKNIFQRASSGILSLDPARIVVAKRCN